MKLPGHIAKRVRALLEEVAVDGGLWSVSPAAAKKEAGKLLLYFQGTRRKPPSKVPKHLQSRKPAKSKIHKQNTRALRAAVMERAEGFCEGCRIANAWLHLDHWLGGSGRRRERQAVQNTWALCRACHQERTDNYPTAAAWNAIFREHCRRHDYPFQPHIDKGMRLKAAPESLNSLAIKDTQS